MKRVKVDLISFINLQVISQKSLENKLFLCAGGLNNKSINKAIEQYGIIPEHRRSYGPIKDFLEKNNR